MTKPKQVKKQQPQINILDFTLRYDYILVEAIRAKSVNGLEIPEQYDDKPEFGRVVKCGEGRLLDDGTVVPNKLKPGNIIYFGKYSSVQLRSNGKDYFVIRDDDVMAVKDE